MSSRNGFLTMFYIILSVVVFECINTCKGMSEHDGMHENHTVTDGHNGHNGHDSHNDHKTNDTTGKPKHDMMNMNHMMMYFHGGVKVTILFKEWAVSTAGGLVGSVIGIFLLALIYEGLKYFREHLFKVHLSSIQFSTVAVTEQNGDSIREVHNITK
ncbi:high affinity copper uptake protein 1-like [Centruroides sculpturatus]|uniref:high affinity copper uptake protein 1-like n=1 Tax=Centruroides sculpturatus TaxID=218467 RepID=UPI000C6EE18B|nr:high affinity copper uptake protein 1-like [Centruroides sculpturatus]